MPNVWSNLTNTREILSLRQDSNFGLLLLCDTIDPTEIDRVISNPFAKMVALIHDHPIRLGPTHWIRWKNRRGLRKPSRA